MSSAATTTVQATVPASAGMPKSIFNAIPEPTALPTENINVMMKTAPPAR